MSHIGDIDLMLDLERELMKTPGSKHGDQAQRAAMYRVLRAAWKGRLFDDEQAKRAVERIFGPETNPPSTGPRQHTGNPKTIDTGCSCDDKAGKCKTNSLRNSIGDSTVIKLSV